MSESFFVESRRFVVWASRRDASYNQIVNSQPYRTRWPLYALRVKLSTLRFRAPFVYLLVRYPSIQYNQHCVEGAFRGHYRGCTSARYDLRRKILSTNRTLSSVLHRMRTGLLNHHEWLTVDASRRVSLVSRTVIWRSSREKGRFWRLSKREAVVQCSTTSVRNPELLRPKTARGATRLDSAEVAPFSRVRTRESAEEILTLHRVIQHPQI